LAFYESLPQNALALTTSREQKISRQHPERQFDKSYYDRYYRNPATRASSPAAAKRQASFIAAYLRHLEVSVASILDVGCGTGMQLRALQRLFPKARTEGVEFSDYLCRKYGWRSGSVTTLPSERVFDLVICNDVLGYLSDADCARALENLANACGAALFLGVLTSEDLELCDPERTDGSQLDRSVRWYRRRLDRHFVNVGGGLYLRKPLNVTVWSLDRL
jgi:SAM-dependent methyltransferase